ncbi:MAG: hypothetical protein KDD92_17060 [Caldilineaceae bacterium]|nr:hypothetical protein [Caldilineaceae bacterium]
MAGLAFLLVLVMLRIAPDATGAFQSPLPTPAGPCFSQSTDGFTLDLYGYVNNDDGTTTLTWQVTSDNKKDISYAAFGLGDWTPVAPEDGATVSGDLGDYRVEWTNDRGNPGFASVKYESEFDGFSQGASDYFVVTVADFGANDSVPVQLKAGNARTTFDVNFDGAGCDKTPPPFSPLPTPTATPEGGVVLPSEPVVPQCVFSPPPGGIPDEPVIPLDAYSFSEPQVVMTSAKTTEIEQWLPDNETVMVIHRTDEGDSPVALLNIDTGETIQPTGSDGDSAWVAKWLSKDGTTFWLKIGASQDGGGIWLHSLAPPGARRLSETGGVKSSIPFDVSPDGKEVLFMSLSGGTQPLIWNQETQELRALPVDLAQWRHTQDDPYYGYLAQTGDFRPFSVYWHPDGDKIFFHDSVRLFLYDLTTDSGCEINLSALSDQYPYVWEAQWSPDGRYLLLQTEDFPPYVTIHNTPGPMLLLDTYTGEAIQHVLDNRIFSFTWMPDSQTAVFIGDNEQQIQLPGNDVVYGVSLYLLNVHSGEYQQILPDYFAGSIDRMMALSPDGSRLAFLGALLDGNQMIPGRGGLYVSQVTMSQ